MSNKNITAEAVIEFLKLIEPMNAAHLRSFVKEIKSAQQITKQKDSFGLSIVDPAQYEYDADIRWFHEAWVTPSFRPIYEAVVKCKKPIQWPAPLK